MPLLLWRQADTQRCLSRTSKKTAMKRCSDSRRRADLQEPCSLRSHSLIQTAPCYSLRKEQSMAWHGTCTREPYSQVYIMQILSADSRTRLTKLRTFSFQLKRTCRQKEASLGRRMTPGSPSWASQSRGISTSSFISC
jgi:hypothetical protein